MLTGGDANSIVRICASWLHWNIEAPSHRHRHAYSSYVIFYAYKLSRMPQYTYIEPYIHIIEIHTHEYTWTYYACACMRVGLYIRLWCGLILVRRQFSIPNAWLRFMESTAQRLNIVGKNSQTVTNLPEISALRKLALDGVGACWCWKSEVSGATAPRKCSMFLIVSKRFFLNFQTCFQNVSAECFQPAGDQVEQKASTSRVEHLEERLAKAGQMSICVGNLLVYRFKILLEKQIQQLSLDPGYAIYGEESWGWSRARSSNFSAIPSTKLWLRTT